MMVCRIWDAVKRLGNHPLWVPVVMLVSYVHAAACPHSTISWKVIVQAAIEDLMNNRGG
jgi:hypothetical protein